MDRPEERRVGRTTQQMIDAPKGAVYIWCNGILDYPKALAMQLGRMDLLVVSPRWLEQCRWMGMRYSGVVLDHAANLTEYQQVSFDHFQAGCVRTMPSE